MMDLCSFVRICRGHGDGLDWDNFKKLIQMGYDKLHYIILFTSISFRDIYHYHNNELNKFSNISYRRKYHIYNTNVTYLLMETYIRTGFSVTLRSFSLFPVFVLHWKYNLLHMQRHDEHLTEGITTI